MTKKELASLQMGDIIRHQSDRMHLHAFVVTGNYGDHITAIRTANVTNPDEWTIVAKAQLNFQE